MSSTVADLDDAVKDAFGQLGIQLLFKILDICFIEVEVFFPDCIAHEVPSDAKFPLKIGKIVYNNDTCLKYTADELIVEDVNSNTFPQPKVCTSHVEIPMSSALTQLLRAEQCTFMVTGKGHSRQCRNKSRRKFGGTVRCHYHM